MNNGHTMLRAQEIALKVGGNTNPGSLMTAIVGYLRSGRVVYLDCVGVAANYIATKAIIMVRGHLMMVGKTISPVPIFLDVVIDGTDERHKTAVRWEVRIDGT